MNKVRRMSWLTFLVAALAKTLLVFVMTATVAARAERSDAEDCWWESQWVYDADCDCWYEQWYLVCQPDPPPPDPIYGCTDPNASNYDPNATADDGSCQYPPPPPTPIYGCTDPNASNYNPNATADDGSCQYPPPPVYGCTNLSASNYNSNATADDGSCQYPPPPVYGCTNPSASNYNPNATADDGSCQYPPPPPPPTPSRSPVWMTMSSGHRSGGGDLKFHVSCGGDLHTSSPGYLEAHAVLSVGAERFETSAAQNYDLWIEVDGDVAASTQNRAIFCQIDYYYRDAGSLYYLGSDSDGKTLQGSGPGSGTLKISTFIRPNWVAHPINIYRVFAGDDRSFAPYNVTSRTVTIYDIANPAVNDVNDLDSPHQDVGITEEYDVASNPSALDAPMPFGRITQLAKDDWTWGSPLKTRWDWASTSSMACYPPERLGPDDGQGSTNRVRCFGSVSNPLVAGSPAIDWDLTFTFRWGENKVQYTVDGCHDGYPAYEAYLNGSTLFQHSDNGNPWSLFPPCDHNVHETGEVR